MKQQFKGWGLLEKNLSYLVKGQKSESNEKAQLNQGQVASVKVLIQKLQANGVIIADEVGMGKTRIAVAVAHAVIRAGGRVAIVLPPGLGNQWVTELKNYNAGVQIKPVLRSLRQYLHAWKTSGNETPWFQEPLVMISHAFSNWRLGSKSESWRWELLPAIYAQWKKKDSGRWPRGYFDRNYDKQVVAAAEAIIDAVRSLPKCNPAQETLQNLVSQIPWPGAFAAEEYGRNADLRPLLEQAVGLGLGVFDLVIIDEAHKSRGQESGVSRLLEKGVLCSQQGRRLALTATPIELDASQWVSMLGRIQVYADDLIGKAIEAYMRSVETVRQLPNDLAVRKAYKASAGNFQRALSPYLLRRDKREEDAVKNFQNLSKEPFYAYRNTKEIVIDVTDSSRLTPAWQQAICAAEALSFVSSQQDDVNAKRLRLTMGKGHGIAALISDNSLVKKTLPDKDDVDCVNDNVQSCFGIQDAIETDKRRQRVNWWKQVVAQPFNDAPSALFNHPVILSAIDKIEQVCGQGEKVLVFGKLNASLRALTQLLNARAMLRCLD